MDLPFGSRLNIASYLLAALALFLILELHLLPALLAGLLVYTLVDVLAPPLQRHLPGARAHGVIVALLSVVVVGILTLIIIGAIAFLRSELGNPRMVFENMMPLIDRARGQLPQIVVDHLPDSIEDFRTAAIDWLRQHATQLQLAGKTAARVIVHLLIGMILGAMVALASALPSTRGGPLADALVARCSRLVHAFHDIVFAQVKISAINTAFTGIFLLVVLPLFGIELPLAKSLVAATFIAGLLPVIGNLISNTLIFVVGLSVSLGVGIAALVFLILIHKLEYFLNARIVGTQIRARAWELLIAMLFMEAAFGSAGVIAAPIYYAYLKRELEAGKLI
ncbi:AI-2E family transporter [Dokdonella soli]|uniref:Membrane protein n=1 Tax=Dokdonella soli TaxID=529810 RepID=A0ABN1IGP9_9GAMM